MQQQDSSIGKLSQASPRLNNQKQVHNFAIESGSLASTAAEIITGTGHQHSSQAQNTNAQSVQQSPASNDAVLAKSNELNAQVTTPVFSQNTNQLQSQLQQQQQQQQQQAINENRLQEVYGNALKQLNQSSYQSSSMQPLAASFRKRQAMLNDKLAGLAKVKVTMARNNAEIDTDMPTIVKGMLEYLPKQKMPIAHKGGLLGVVAVNRVDTGKFESSNFTSTNAMKQLGAFGANYMNPLAADVRTKNKSDLEYQQTFAEAARMKYQRDPASQWPQSMQINSPKDSLKGGTFERASPRLAIGEQRSRANHSNCRSIDNTPSPTFGNNNKVTQQQQRARSSIEIATQLVKSVDEDRDIPARPFETPLRLEQQSNSIVAISRTAVPNMEASFDDGDDLLARIDRQIGPGRQKYKQFKSPYEQKLPLLMNKNDFNNSNNNKSNLNKSSNNSTPLQSKNAAVRAQQHANSIVAMTNSYRGAGSIDNRNNQHNISLFLHQNQKTTSFEEKRNSFKNQQQQRSQQYTVLQKQAAQIASEGLMNHTKRQQQLLDCSNNNDVNNLMDNHHSATIPNTNTTTNSAKIQLQPVIAAQQAPGNNSNNPMTSKTFQGNMLASALNLSQTAANNTTAANSLPFANLSFSSAKVEQHNRYSMYDNTTATIGIKNNNAAASQGGKQNSDMNLVYGPWCHTKSPSSHPNKKQNSAILAVSNNSNRFDIGTALNGLNNNRLGSSSLSPVKTFKQQKNSNNNSNQVANEGFGEYMTMSTPFQQNDGDSEHSTNAVKKLAQQEKYKAIPSAGSSNAPSDILKLQQRVHSLHNRGINSGGILSASGKETGTGTSRQIGVRTMHHTPGGVTVDIQYQMQNHHQQQQAQRNNNYFTAGGGPLATYQQQSVVATTPQKHKTHDMFVAHHKHLAKSSGSPPVAARQKHEKQLLYYDQKIAKATLPKDMVVVSAQATGSSGAPRGFLQPPVTTSYPNNPCGLVSHQIFNPFIFDSNLPASHASPQIAATHQQINTGSTKHKNNALSEVRPYAADNTGAAKSQNPPPAARQSSSKQKQQQSSLLFENISNKEAVNDKKGTAAATGGQSSGKETPSKLNSKNGVDQLSKALHFQQLGEFLAKQTMTLPVAAAASGIHNTTANNGAIIINSCYAPQQPPSLLQYTKLKRPTDLVSASTVQQVPTAPPNQKNHERAAINAFSQQKQQNEIVDLSNNGNNASELRKSIQRQQQQQQKPVQTQDNQLGMSVDGSIVHTVYRNNSMVVGKAATYSPRKSAAQNHQQNEKQQEQQQQQQQSQHQSKNQVLSNNLDGNLVGMKITQEPEEAKNDRMKLIDNTKHATTAVADSSCQKKTDLAGIQVVDHHQHHLLADDTYHANTSSQTKKTFDGDDGNKLVTSDKLSLDRRTIESVKLDERHLKIANGSSTAAELDGIKTNADQGINQQLIIFDKKRNDDGTEQNADNNSRNTIQAKTVGRQNGVEMKQMNTDSSDEDHQIDIGQKRKDKQRNRLKRDDIDDDDKVEESSACEIAASIDEHQNSVVDSQLLSSPRNSIQNLNQNSQSHRKISARKFTKQKSNNNSTHTQGNQQSRSRRNQKRKNTTRSIISSKPTLRSSYSRVQASVANKTALIAAAAAQQSSQQQQAQSSNGSQTVAIPAVHDLSSSSGKDPNKFVTDARRIDIYYNSTAAKPGSNQTQHRQQQQQQQLIKSQQIEEEYYLAKSSSKFTATANNNNSNAPGGTDHQVAAAPLSQSKSGSNYGGSRAGKRVSNKQHGRKQSQNSMAYQAPNSSHLSSAKSQPKILTRRSRGSQRSSSAVRSPNALQSQTTITSNYYQKRHQSGQQQCQQQQQQQPPPATTSSVASGARPKTVINNKAASGGAVPQKAVSKPNQTIAESSSLRSKDALHLATAIGKRQSIDQLNQKEEEKEISKMKNQDSQADEEQKLTTSAANKVNPADRINTNATGREQIQHQNARKLHDAPDYTETKVKQLVNVELKSPLYNKRTSSMQVATSREQSIGTAREIKQLREPQIILTATENRTNNQRVINQSIPTNTATTTTGELKVLTGVKKDTSSSSTNNPVLAKSEIKVSETGATTTFKTSQVKRVRQIHNLQQKTLDCVPTGINSKAGGALNEPIQVVTTMGQNGGKLLETNHQAVKEPLSAAKVVNVPSKNKLQSAFSMMSRCASDTSQVKFDYGGAANTANQNGQQQSIPQTKQLQLAAAQQEEEEQSSSASAANHLMIDEEIVELPPTTDANNKEPNNIGSSGSNKQQQQHYQATSVVKTGSIATCTNPLLQQKSSSPYNTIDVEDRNSSSGEVESRSHCDAAVNVRASIESVDQQSQQQYTSTIAPKLSSSSMKQHQPMRSFHCDDEYIVSATSQPYCSCKSYVVIDSHHSKVVQSKNQDEVREMASLTKMMTAIVTLELAQEMRMDIRSTYFKVSQKAATTTGTTAYLVDGQVLSIWDLLHGLMLPSGNDAAMVLAENFSDRILRKENRSNRATDGSAANEPLKAPVCNVSQFVKVMNKTARKMHMKLTNYANPHGLADKSNHSTAYELAYMANQAMKNETFRQIVNTKTFTSINFMPLRRAKRLPNHEFTQWQSYDEHDVPFPHGGVQFVRYYQTWYNSNKLLDEPGFSGVKTGQTSTAGCCLAIYYRNTAIGKNLVTVVLGSKSIEYRWKDTRRLTLWTDAILMDEHAKKLAQAKGVSTNAQAKRQAPPGFRT